MKNPYLILVALMILAGCVAPTSQIIHIEVTSTPVPATPVPSYQAEIIVEVWDYETYGSAGGIFDWHAKAIIQYGVNNKNTTAEVMATKTRKEPLKISLDNVHPGDVIAAIIQTRNYARCTINVNNNTLVNVEFAGVSVEEEEFVCQATVPDSR